MAGYKINDIDYPGVTTILGTLDKSDALMPWAVRMNNAYIMEKLSTVKLPADDSEQAMKDYRGGMENLLSSSAKNYREASYEAMDIGSEIHDLIEKYIKNGKDAVGDMRSEVENGFLAFLEWEEKYDVEWLESEKTIVDTDHCFAGTMDCLCRFGENCIEKLLRGKTYVGDFKSSKGFYDTYPLQIAAYWNARQKLGITPDHEYNIVSRFGKISVEKYSPVDINGSFILRLDKTTGFPEFKDYTKTHEKSLKAMLALTDFYYAFKKRRLKNNPRVA
jgi:hypothetical protein